MESERRSVVLGVAAVASLIAMLLATNAVRWNDIIELIGSNTGVATATTKPTPRLNTEPAPSTPQDSSVQQSRYNDAPATTSVPKSVEKLADDVSAEAARTTTSQQPDPSIIEVTRSDFTKIGDLRSANLTIFGIRLGQTEYEAKAAASKAGLTWDDIYLYNQYADTELHDSRHSLVAVLTTQEGVQAGVKQVTNVVLDPGIVPYLNGNAARLFSSAMIDFDSPLRLALLGREDQHSETDLTRSYWYWKEGIEVRCFISPGAASGTVAINLFGAREGKERR